MNSVLIAIGAARSRKFIHPSGYMKVNNYSMMFHCAKHQKTCPGILALLQLLVYKCYSHPSLDPVFQPIGIYINVKLLVNLVNIIHFYTYDCLLYCAYCYNIFCLLVMMDATKNG